MSEEAYTSYRDFEPKGFHVGLLVATTNWIGAGLSVFLVLGLVFWGYKLTVRDVTDIPVVRALEGPTRVRPDEPGGATVAHKGLAVNAVPAEGGVEAPPDRVVLAPRPLDLSEEDEAQVAMVPEPRAVEDVSALATENTSAAIENAIQAAVAEEIRSKEARRLATLPGVKRSPRPQPRGRVASLDTGVPKPGVLAGSGIDAPAESITAGTQMVQLGAFDDRETAIREWDAIVARHGDLVGGHKRFIQKAQSGG
ncbi:MAG: SPOR domain-containing protein, partial [Paracoccaceae bacterium]